MQVQRDNTQFRFTLGSNDHWDAHGTVTYTPDTTDCALLHELAHALLGHSGYHFDIDLLRLERKAWDHARRVLAPRYNVTITQDDSENALDTYRDWLHNRSLCPDCHLSGLQTSTRAYLCVACARTWRANPAKTCALRRYRLPAGPLKLK